MCDKWCLITLFVRFYFHLLKKKEKKKKEILISIGDSLLITFLSYLHSLAAYIDYYVHQTCNEFSYTLSVEMLKYIQQPFICFSSYETSDIMIDC